MWIILQREMGKIGKIITGNDVKVRVVDVKI